MPPVLWLIMAAVFAQIVVPSIVFLWAGDGPPVLDADPVPSRPVDLIG